MKKILVTLAAISLASFAFAQEFDFGGGDDFSGGDDFGGGFEEESAPALSISGEVGGNARAWIGTPAKTVKNETTGEDETIPYNTSGYDSFYDLSKTELDANAYANLELNYDGDYTATNVKLKLDTATIKDHPEDVIDEASVTGSFKEGKFQVKAGKLKEVWGKGDKIHVLDNFNANDYTDFVFPDYIDRRLGEVMFKATANLSWDYNLKLEGIFTPWMTADRFAESGMLVPASMTTLTNTVSGIVKHNAGIDLKSTLEETEPNYESLVDGLNDLSSFSADNLYEDNLRSLKYAQGGLRLTGTAGGIDWGASYYYGHYKQPSANLGAYIDSIGTSVRTYAATSDGQTAIKAKYLDEITSLATNKYRPYYASLVGKTVVDPATGASVTLSDDTAIAKVAGNAAFMETCQNHAQEIAYGMAGQKFELPSLNYDQLQVFGLEAAFVLWKLNTRWEFAYNLTEDTAGDNPWVKNNSIGWVVGFDIDLPIHNLNLNVQETGTYILKNDKVEDGVYSTYDVDYNSDGKYTKNKLIFLLSDKFLNEKLTAEIQGIWGIECKEFMIAPKVEYNVIEGLTFAARFAYLYSNNENGEFYNFTADSEHHDKMFLQLTAKYQF